MLSCCVSLRKSIATMLMRLAKKIHPGIAFDPKYILLDRLIYGISITRISPKDVYKEKP